MFDLSKRSFSLTKIALLFCAASLGGVIAWATTGVFHFGFIQGLLFGFAISLGTTGIDGVWLWLSAVLLVLFGWFTQTWGLGWELIGPMLTLSPLLLGKVSRIEQLLSPAKLGLMTYAILILAIIFGGMPVWCLLALFTLPVAWQIRKTTQEQRITLVFLVELFITIGYLIKGLVR
jgi:hypothetical protein